LPFPTVPQWREGNPFRLETSSPNLFRHDFSVFVQSLFMREVADCLTVARCAPGIGMTSFIRWNRTI
jgi:hypothetical protein